MTTHRIFVREGASTEDSTQGTISQKREKYLVCSPIFKNGHLYEIGDIIELTESTAKGFLELNEIKEIE